MKKKRIFDIIQIGNKGDTISRSFDIFISIVIILNILAMFLETFDGLSAFWNVFKITELVTVIIFCVEYILRIWTADLLYPRKSHWRSVMRFLFSFDGIVDLLTILPFFFLDGMVIFRMLRVVRIFHLFRINAQYDSFNLIKDVLMERRKQILSSLFIILILVLASSLAIYGAEHEIQPEAFENAFSGIWWSVSTLLTVGYGDIYPITVIGRLLAIFIAFLGVCAVAIPTGIISAGFVEKFTKNEHKDKKFPDIKDIGEIICDRESGLIGLTVNEVREKYDIWLYMVIRGDLTIVPAGPLKLEENDILIINSPKLTKDNAGKKKR